MSTLIKAGLVAVTLLATLSPATAARFRGGYYGGFDGGYGIGYGGRIGGFYGPVYRDYRAAPARVYFDQMQRYGN